MNKLEKTLKLADIPEIVNDEFLTKYNFYNSCHVHADNEVYENQYLTMVIRAAPVGDGYNVGAKWKKK